MTRRVTNHKRLSYDNKLLRVITVYEPGVNKETVKQLNRHTKRHHVLIPHKNNYKWLR